VQSWKEPALDLSVVAVGPRPLLQPFAAISVTGQIVQTLFVPICLSTRGPLPFGQAATLTITGTSLESGHVTAAGAVFSAEDEAPAVRDCQY
jgi:hypothetical protein